jgi:hypothetical protein
LSRGKFVSQGGVANERKTGDKKIKQVDLLVVAKNQVG